MTVCFRSWLVRAGDLPSFLAFIAYQYYLHVVPTTYISPRSAPLHTNQYSVTHYTRKLSDHQGTPGIFFKFDLDPMVITIHQRTTTITQLFIRCLQITFLNEELLTTLLGVLVSLVGSSLALRISSVSQSVPSKQSLVRTQRQESLPPNRQV